jgi:hypothetical protein
MRIGGEVGNLKLEDAEMDEKEQRDAQQTNQKHRKNG